jgi:hypothetical protein
MDHHCVVSQPSGKGLLIRCLPPPVAFDIFLPKSCDEAVHFE